MGFSPLNLSNITIWYPSKSNTSNERNFLLLSNNPPKQRKVKILVSSLYLKFLLCKFNEEKSLRNRILTKNRKRRLRIYNQQQQQLLLYKGDTIKAFNRLLDNSQQSGQRWGNFQEIVSSCLP